MNEPTASPTWPIVQAFAKEMEAKLVANAHKGGPEGWRSTDVWALRRRMHEEMSELGNAIAASSGHDDQIRAIQREAADVANFALFIWDWYQSRLDKRAIQELDDVP